MDHPTLRKPALMLLLATGSFTVPAAEASQGTGHLRGTIIDGRTGEALAGMEVTFVQIDFSARTNDSGSYSIANIPAGRYTVLVKGIGFKPAIAPRHVLVADTVNVLDFELEAMVTELQGVEVIATEDLRKSTYASNVIRPDELPRNMDLILALEGKAAGLALVRSPGNAGADVRDERGLSLRGLQRDVLWVIDGTVIPPPLTFVITTSEVACVEIRRGAAAAQRFARSIRTDPRARGYSGVILVWTVGSRSPMPEECVSG